MKAPQIPANEKERLQVLESYSILDTLPENDYDNITAIASQICNMPVSMVTLIDSDRQWFKSRHGMQLTETPREYAFCGHAINIPDDIFMVKDAREDDRFFDNPYVTGDSNVVFYAGVPLVGKEGLPLGTLCVIDDKPGELTKEQVTTLKALSNQVMNLLELRRTKATLEKSLSELKELNTELENFAHVAAHDLKSPLNNISGLADIFLSQYGDDLDEEGLQFIQLILTASKNLRSLIDGLLQYSKSNKMLNDGHNWIETTAFFTEIKSLFTLEKNGRISIKTDVQSLFTNKIALEQVFINLISNAIKYNDKPKPAIEITLSENPTHYLFSVSDNGSGIQDKHFEKIFRVFETVSNEDRYGDKGNGIGLAVVKKIISSLNGTITVASEIGKGTTFTFSVGKEI